MDMNLLLDIIEILAGVYLCFLALRMKKTGVVSDNGLVSKGLDIKKAPDPQGYIKAMFPWNILLGVLLIACGVFSRYSTATGKLVGLQVASIIIAVITILVYAFCSMRAQKKYLEPHK